MEIELKRRREYDHAIQKKVRQMRDQLKKEIDKELTERMDFNDQNYRYLPTNLRILIEAPPIRYDIYPKTTAAAVEA
jgi:hypothetical protein